MNLHQTPMLSRLKRQFLSSRFRLPRRGRIRFFSLFVIIALAVTFYKYKEAGASFTAQDAYKTAPLSVTAKSNSRKDGFTLATVAELLKQKPPIFNSIPDTILWKNKKLVAYLSIDSSLQRYGEVLMQRYHPKYGALVAVEPATGRVLAMVSYTNKDEASLGDNISCKALFPAASVIKTVTASGAIEKGLLDPSSQLTFVGNRYTLYKYQLTENAQRGRQTSFQDAFAYSMNPVFGRIGIYMLGKETLAQYLERFGFNTVIPFELPSEPSVAQHGDSLFALAQLASGFNQETKISALHGALLASSICSRGTILCPTLVDSIRQVNNEQCLYRTQPHVWRTPIKPATADNVMQLMSKVTSYGTAQRSFRQLSRSARYSDITFGGKTGSIDQDGVGRVDWFIGFAGNKNDRAGQIAIGVVTVHGKYWTVHSSYLAAEIFRTHIDKIEMQARRKPTPESSDPALCAVTAK